GLNVALNSVNPQTFFPFVRSVAQKNIDSLGALPGIERHDSVQKFGLSIFHPRHAVVIAFYDSLIGFHQVLGQLLALTLHGYHLPLPLHPFQIASGGLFPRLSVSQEDSTFASARRFESRRPGRARRSETHLSSLIAKLIDAQ